MLIEHLAPPPNVFPHKRAPHSRPYLVPVMAITLAALGLRLLTIALAPTEPVSDFWSLFTRAQNLHDSGSYDAIPGRPDATFPPLYPILLSISFYFSQDRLLTAKLVNTALGIASVFLVAELSYLLFGARAAILAGLIQALYPRSILAPELIAAENLFLPLILLWAIMAVRYFLKEAPSTWILIALGVISGLLTLTRSVACLTWLLIPLISLASRRGVSHILKELALLATVSTLVLLPWGLRNVSALGRFTVLNSTGGVDLFIGNNPHATGNFYAWQADIVAEDPAFFQRDVLDQDATARTIAIQWIARNPVKALHLYIVKFARMFSNERFVADFAAFYGPIEPPWPAQPPLPLDHPARELEQPIVFLLNLGFLLLLLLEIAGVLSVFLPSTRLGPRMLWAAASVVLSAFYFPLVAAAYHSITRYRWPFTDLLIPFAALTLLLSAQWITRTITRKLNIRAA